MRFNEGSVNVIVLIVLFLIVVFLGKLFIDFSDRKNLVYGKKKARHALLNFAKVRSYKLFSNITIDYNGVKTHFDYLVVGFFGLLAVNVLEPVGEYCGEENQDKWVYSNEKIRDYIENPIKQNNDALVALKKIIGKELNTYKFTLESVTVFGGKPNKTPIYTKALDKVCYAKKLAKYLQDGKFGIDNDVDVEAVSNLITKYL
ncbi:MAG: nuclease-related domain-containing protein [Oscillospiraceae bacterium]